MITSTNFFSGDLINLTMQLLTLYSAAVGSCFLLGFAVDYGYDGPPRLRPTLMLALILIPTCLMLNGMDEPFIFPIEKHLITLFAKGTPCFIALLNGIQFFIVLFRKSPDSEDDTNSKDPWDHQSEKK